MAAAVVQRVVFPRQPALAPLYYRGGGGAAEVDRFSCRLAPGSTLSTDTYFNSFFESSWRRHTGLGRLRLRLELAGRGEVRLVGRAPRSGPVVLAGRSFDGDETAVELEDPGPGAAGALHFEVAAASAVTLRRGEWRADGPAAPVAVVAAYCTFNREAQLARNVLALLEDADVAAVLRLVVVVDQGSRPVRRDAAFRAAAAAAGGRLRLIEQDNFGGAGGFTRAILEARQTPGATHVLLMDDDTVPEAESVLRAAAFLARARGDLAVGGPMLDLRRPLEVYEAGGVIDAAGLGVRSPVHRASAASPESLAPFLEPAATQYNAWWFFAFPLRLVDRFGLPLPLFLRGDDAEFGCRLHKGGVPTVTLPGLGVWHEPLCLNRGGWQPYYDLRNLLILTALHGLPPPWRAAREFLGRMVGRLLSLDYRQAAFLRRAVDDFCRGPSSLEADPRGPHRELAGRPADPSEAPPAGLPERVGAARPGSFLGKKWRLLRCLLRQVVRASPAPQAPPTRAVPEADADWWSLGLDDVVAVRGPHESGGRVLRRSRRRFVDLLLGGLRSALRLWWSYPRVAAAWRTASARLTSEAFWRSRLGLGGPEPVDEDPRSAA